MKKLYKLQGLFYIGMVLLAIASLVGAVIPLGVRGVIDDESLLEGGNTLWLLAGLFLGQTLAQVAGSYLLAVFAEGQIKTLRNRLASTIVYGKKEQVDRHNSGEMSAHIVNNSNQLKDYLVKYLPNFISGLLTIAISVIFLISLDLKLTLVLVCGLTFLILFTFPTVSFSQKYGLLMQEQMSQLISFLGEMVRDLPIFKTNTAESKQMQYAEEHIEEMRSVSLKNNLIDALVTPIVLMVLFGSVAAIFMYGGSRVAEGTLTVGTLVSFLIYLFQLLNPFGSIAEYMTQKGRLAGSLEPLQKILMIDSEDYESGFREVSGELALRDVQFSYGNDFQLLDITMDYPSYRKIALVGPSGSGKSTLVHLLLRLYTIDGGHMQFGKSDYRDINLEAWRHQFSLVSQQSSLISGTVRENLVLGIDETVSDNVIWTALEQASIAEEIKGLPDGLDTDIGESGKFLSGGQQQRLQIARALVRNTPYIIFDEATSNLDSDTQATIGDTIDRLTTDKTLIIIAHRLSTITDADHIYFLEHGRLTGRGTHDVLYNTHDVYRRYIDGQIIE